MMLRAKMTRANLNQNEWVHFQRITIIIVHNRNLTENAIPRSNSKAAFTKEKESICAAMIWTIPGQRFPMTF
jgi:hypothetical protein